MLNNNKYLVIVRHGERLDNLDPECDEVKATPYDYNLDTPLSNNGFI